MSGETINQDGTPVLIEAVYWRYHSPYIEECDSIEEAVSLLDSGEDYGTLSSVGVFVEGEPHTWKYGGSLYGEPTEKDIALMREQYAEAKAKAKR